MKSTIKKIFFLPIISFLFIISCSKSEDDKTTAITETPIKTTVTTFAGSTQGDVVGSAAKFNGPALMAINSAGLLFVADFYNSKIKTIAKDGDVREVLISSTQSLLNPYGVATDGTDIIYVADSGNHKIKKITYGALKSTKTIAGSSIGDIDSAIGVAKLNNPIGIAFYSSTILFADTNNHKIKIIPTTVQDVITKFGSSVGDKDDEGTNAKINKPYGLIVSNSGIIYFADTANNKIKKINSPDVVTTIAGSTTGDSDGSALSAKFNNPQGLAIDVAGNIYVTDTGNHKIKKIDTNGKVTTIAGSTVGDLNGTGDATKFNSPVGIVVDKDGNLYISDFFNNKIKKITFN